MNRITNEEREAIVREAVAKRDALLSERRPMISETTTTAGGERARFEAWYDAQPDGKLQPWDVWRAATSDAISSGHACRFAIDGGGNIYRRYAEPTCEAATLRAANKRLATELATLLSASEQAIPRLAHKFDCYSARPTSEWPEHGSVSYANCCCERKDFFAAIESARAALTSNAAANGEME